MAAFPVRALDAPKAHGAPIRYPLTQPNSPKLSAFVHDLAAIEASHWLSNYGPTNKQLESKFIETVFDGQGSCLTVCNATIGLVTALKAVTEPRGRAARFVIMPSFTFAAAAHAVLWCGLTPLLVDVDEDSWASSCQAELALLRKYGRRIAAIMPYATFGSCLDLAHYDRISDEFGVPVVVDAAASLGTLDIDGRAFGTGSNHLFVFSMHATKAFGVGEGGLIYSNDADKIKLLRRMGNFGFDSDRSAQTSGLNSKLSEFAALAALVKLGDFKTQVLHRWELAHVYQSELPNLTTQRLSGSLIAFQFMPMLLPTDLAAHRQSICAHLGDLGVGTGCYFSPHIAQQSYFASRCISTRLTVTADIASRIISLPISDFLSVDDVSLIAASVRDACAAIERPALSGPILSGENQCLQSVTAL